MDSTGELTLEEFAAKWRARRCNSLFLGEADDGLRRSLAQNLADGRFRIVLAVDVINPAMKRMIEYLNAMGGPETSVIAVEYSRLKQGAVEILMPQVYGQELAEAKNPPDTRSMTAWDETTFRSWLQDHDSENLTRFDALLTSARSAGLTFAGSKTVYPAGSLPVSNGDKRLGTVSIFHFSGLGTSLEVNLTRMSKMSDEEMPDPELLDLFLRKLADIPAVQNVAANLRSSRFASRKPNVPLANLSMDSIHEVVGALRTLSGERY